MRSIVVTGADGPLGRRVAALLRGDPDIVVVEAAPDAEPSALLGGADALVHLRTLDRAPAAPGDAVVAATRRLLDAADTAAISGLVVLSSAIVYGAWADNPVPLTEEAPLRPNPGVADAVAYAEAERLVSLWGADHPGVAVAVLRPAATLGPGVDSALAQALSGRALIRPDGSDPDRQLVHVDDVAAAVVAAVIGRLDGVFNVAPHGYVTGEAVRELGAWRPSIPVPRWGGPAAVRWARALRLSSMPPALLPLVEHSWIVASDKLQATGWEPQYTSEEAVVAGRPASRWREMGPGRRQTVALTATGLAGASLAAGVAAAVVRARARRRVS